MGPSDPAERGTPCIDIVEVTTDRLDDLAELFETNGATRGCWCMWPILPHKQAQAGWSGGNRVAFTALAATSPEPLGLIAYEDGVPAGWCAVGPRARYEHAVSPRSSILRDRDPAEDGAVWLVPCFFVRVGHRRQGTTGAMLAAAVDLAAAHGAIAVEGFPLSDDAPKADGYLGRRSVFERQGFRCIAEPTPRRAVMRKELR